jgi:hypothetical protein
MIMGNRFQVSGFRTERDLETRNPKLETNERSDGTFR